MEVCVALVVMKRGGQPGKVAINTDLVTYVRSAPGPFTDIHFGEHHVSVEGSFEYVVSRLGGTSEVAAAAPAKTWIRTT
jgi:hypothetical protein